MIWHSYIFGRLFLQNDHFGITGFAFVCLVYGDYALFKLFSLRLFN
jgi:hypothetical protein